MNGSRLTKMAVEIVSLTHVVTTPDYDVFPHIQSRAAEVPPKTPRKMMKLELGTKIHATLPAVLISLDGDNFNKYDSVPRPLYRP